MPHVNFPIILYSTEALKSHLLFIVFHNLDLEW